VAVILTGGAVLVLVACVAGFVWSARDDKKKAASKRLPGAS
jgi:hypothetical protein